LGLVKKPVGPEVARKGLLLMFCAGTLQFLLKMARSLEKLAYSKFVDHEPSLQQVLTSTSHSESH
jgi:hypothetical protein